MNAHLDPPLLGISQRLPPANVEAEQSLLGALLTNNKAFDRVAEFLRPEHFAHPAHGRIYRAIATHIIAGRVVNAVTLKTEFENSGVLDELGGTAYLATLLSAMVGLINAGEYGRAVYEAWQRRELIDVGEELVNGSFTAAKPPSELAAAIVARMDGITATGRDRPATTFDEAMEAAIRASDEAAKRQGPIGVSTGMPSVDDVLGGLEPGTLTILAGRPGMGKTALGIQWAISAARAGHQVWVVSLEMPAAALARRALASAANVSVTAIRRGTLSPSQAGRLVQVRREMAGLPLAIEDNAGLTPSMITLKASMWRRRKGLDLLVLDHLHNVRPEASAERGGPTWAVGQVAQSIQQLAKNLNVPVLALAQLNRAADMREDHRPTKADLRQAGDIEQCADAIAFIYRKEYYLGKSEPEEKVGEGKAQHEKRVMDWRESKEKFAGVAELIFAKVRDGAEGEVTLRWHAETMRFSELQE